MTTTLVTGAAGFIGYHVAKALLDRGYAVVGLDNISPYYSTALKEMRLNLLRRYPQFKAFRADICEPEMLAAIWRGFRPTRVIHLAAQAGVRHSLKHPMDYIQSNVVGFQHVLEAVREWRPENFVYASSSSVYGGLKTLPFRESDDITSPVSLYAATKASNEIVAKAYSNLYGIPSTGLRFFTVYGPWGRPDMALYKFARAMLAGEAIDVYNDGAMIRDWTYVDDIVSGILAAHDKPQQGKVYNLGCGAPYALAEMVAELESALGVKAKLNLLPMQPGDAERTEADTTLAAADLGFAPKVTPSVGVRRFVAWYREIGHKFAR